MGPICKRIANQSRVTEGFLGVCFFFFVMFYDDDDQTNTHVKVFRIYLWRIRTARTHSDAIAECCVRVGSVLHIL